MVPRDATLSCGSALIFACIGFSLLYHLILFGLHFVSFRTGTTCFASTCGTQHRRHSPGFFFSTSTQRFPSLHYLIFICSIFGGGVRSGDLIAVPALCGIVLYRSFSELPGPSLFYTPPAISYIPLAQDSVSDPVSITTCSSVSLHTL
jgi:hypothetical protein